MKPIINLAIGLTLIAFCGCCNLKNNNEIKIAIVSIVDIEVIADLKEGFKETIEASDLYANKNVVFEEYNAQGDNSIINQIVDKLVTDKPDLVYVLGTPIAQAIQNRAPDILIVQGAATDPVSAGLAESWVGSNKNYAANSDLPPIGKQLLLIQQLIPDLSTLGVVYNPGEVNSVAVVDRLRAYITDNNLNIVLSERSVSNSSEVGTASESLVGNVQAVYIPPDNTVHSALDVIGKIAVDNGLPLFATTESAIQSGAIASLSLNFRELGKEAGIIALDILSGKKKPGEIPILFSERPSVIVNSKVAALLGVNIESLSDSLNVIVQ